MVSTATTVAMTATITMATTVITATTITMETAITTAITITMPVTITMASTITMAITITVAVTITMAITITVPVTITMASTITMESNIYKPNGKIEGVRGYSTQLRGVKGGVHLEVEDSRGRVRNSLTLEQNGTHVKGMRSFTVGGFFAAEKPDFRLLSGARNLHGRHIETGRVAGPLGEKAVYRSDAFTKLKGSEGTRIEGKEILLTADQEVRLKSVNGSIILTGGKGGISLDVKSIPIVTKSLGGYLASQYKVCVCMPQGKLFRVPVSKDYNSQMGCYNIDVSPQHNPCM
ncbi:unnamed protein product [Nesidiocoris tenuis]|uniref:Beta-sarcoglycan n=1 Tax=Nesidiocoris tenuis TaxID=355587 RepID=A0A6H5HJ84_9HEMI|nr:unnamed protein product [Nesidiocoris tenuis]